MLDEVACGQHEHNIKVWRVVILISGRYLRSVREKLSHNSIIFHIIICAVFTGFLLNIFNPGFLHAEPDTPPIFSSADDFIKSKIRIFREQIKTMQGDMAFIIYAQQPIVQRGKFFYKAPGKLRMDFHSPSPTSIIQHGTGSYLKSFNSASYTKVNNENALAHQSDLFGFSILNQYKYKLSAAFPWNAAKSISSGNRMSAGASEKADENPDIDPEDLPSDLASPDYIATRYYGYIGDGDESRLAAVVDYDPEKGIITSYKLIGNEVNPQSRINLKSYRKVNNINIPHKLEIIVSMGASVKTTIIINKVKLNEEIGDEIFTVR